jgi:light-harvesting protein B-800-850 alpha chain
MNQGRIWCVVHPTVGLPLFLGSVALTSLAVHTAVMTHTTWMSNYWQGAKARVADATPSQDAKPAAFSMTVTPAPVAGGATPTAFVITVTPTGAPQATVAAVQAPAAAHAAGPLHTASTD